MEKSYFFNSVGGDRKYEASSFAEYFSSVLTNGVHPSPSTSLQIIADDTMFVEVQPGRAYINGYLYVNSLPKKLPIGVADGVLKRKDLIVCRLDMTNRSIITDIKKGTPSANPIAPNLTRTEVIYELALAEITINAAAPFISQANVLDTRLDKSRCGYINSLIQAETTTIFNDYKNWYETKTAEYETDWENWYQSVRDQISNDDHTQINERIQNLETVKASKTDVANAKINPLFKGFIDFQNQSWTPNAARMYQNANDLSDNLGVIIDTGANKANRSLRLELNLRNGQEGVRFKNGDNVMHDMLHKGNIKEIVQAGVEVITPSEASTPTSKRIFFSAPFKQAPIITATAASSVVGTSVTGVGVSGVTESYFDLYLTRLTTTATSVNWVATPKTQ